MSARVTAVVLAAGGSTRLGRPKQLLPYRGRTLLDAVLDTARAAAFDHVVVALGGAADQVRQQVDLHGVEVALNPDFGEGCGSSIRSALDLVPDHADGLVLLLGDQPGVTVQSIDLLRSHVGAAPVGVCWYDDGPAHPLWFSRAMFGELASLHGDKAAWKLVDAAANSGELVEVEVPGLIPRDVDTWDDYEAVVRSSRTSAS